ncbi:MAG: hypothetical protein ACRC0L_00665, partial [Angustibacter sp.]
LAWGTAVPVSGRNQLLVGFTTDGSDCQVLGRATAVETERTVTVTLLVGELPGVDCSGPRPAIAFPAEVVIDLRAPLADRSVVQPTS